MATANRKSTSLTHVAKFNRNLKSFGSMKDMNKVKQGNMRAPYPKEPLESQPGISLLKPPGSFSLLARGNNINIRVPRKASSTTLLRSDQRLPRRRITCRKTIISERKQRLQLNQSEVCKNIGCTKPRCCSAEQNVRYARKSATKLKPASKEKPTVVKLHLSSPDLSKIHAGKSKVNKE